MSDIFILFCLSKQPSHQINNKHVSTAKRQGAIKIADHPLQVFMTLSIQTTSIRITLQIRERQCEALFKEQVRYKIVHKILSVQLL